MVPFSRGYRGWAVVGFGALAVGACVSTPEDGGDGGGGSGGATTDGSGGTTTDGSGGAKPGGTGGAAPGAGGVLGGAGGLGGEGGAGDACSLPFEMGDCDAAIPVYFHNASTERCEPAVYGGCGGNENRFSTYADCERACDVEPTGAAACQVEAIVYPDGYTPVPDPASCNTCTCSDGQLDSCTEINCPTPCPEGSILATDCAACGPTDACEVVRTLCLPACDDQADCSHGGGVCSSGACRNVCG